MATSHPGPGNQSPQPTGGQHTPRSSKTLQDVATDVVHLLRAAGQTVGVAESLTAGGVMTALTSVPGASAVFRGGVVSYATELKQTLLGVDAALIAREGVVHGEVAAQMAEGARRATSGGGSVDGEGVGKGERGDGQVLTPTTWGIGTTGVAGPDMQDGKPVGTVYIGVASPAGSRAWGPFLFPGSRERVREATVMEALSRLREALLAETAEDEGGT